jgi:hypothetical protein
MPFSYFAKLSRIAKRGSPDPNRASIANRTMASTIEKIKEQVDYVVLTVEGAGMARHGAAFDGLIEVAKDKIIEQVNAERLDHAQAIDIMHTLASSIFPTAARTEIIQTIKSNVGNSAVAAKSSTTVTASNLYVHRYLTAAQWAVLLGEDTPYHQKIDVFVEFCRTSGMHSSTELTKVPMVAYSMWQEISAT